MLIEASVHPILLPAAKASAVVESKVDGAILFSDQHLLTECLNLRWMED